MAKAAATQLPSFLPSPPGKTRKSPKPHFVHRVQRAKESAVTSRDPWTSGRQTRLSAGRAPLRASLRFVNTTRSKALGGAMLKEAQRWEVVFWNGKLRGSSVG
ncbi:unnamed protein product [Sphagnum troendelagicum]